MTLLLSALTDQDAAAKLLQAGELVAVPTETVYGLAADASNPQAVAKIFTAKGRPANHPLIVHIGDLAQLSDWARDIPPQALLLAKAFWPGPLTLLLAKADNVSPVVTGGKDSIGIRMPAHPVLLALLQLTGLAVAAPSANPYKKLSPTSASQVMAGLNGRIAAVLDGGDCSVGLESTIVDLTSDHPQVLRAGPISAAELETVLGVPVSTPTSHNVAVPGNVKAHYQPGKPLKIFSKADLHSALQQSSEAVICLYQSAEFATLTLPHSRQMPQDKAGYARLLYRSLFEADAMPGSQIYLEQPPQTPEWDDVNDRLRRACS
ncbi:L-threonylcarbamoyladenylate synthase [Rheinheimera sp.]|uniref:L-threonylcarbamoyladenylate synthase n=1 Tax=Rheinheimera sp. TaxID=1869214 RepID=UPI003D26FE32